MSAASDWRRSPAKRLQARVISSAGYRLVALLGSTLRWRVEGLEHFDGIVKSGRQPIMAFWHGRILPATLFWNYGSIQKLSAHLGGHLGACGPER